MKQYCMLSVLHICRAGWGEVFLQDGTYPVNAHWAKFSSYLH